MAKGATGGGDAGHGFGTFEGVFLPSILTMLGAIMFLRVNYVAGEAGIKATLLILAAATSIVLATALSISAISTNMPVKGGGAYYLISRTLGPGFGGSIGITLFLAQALSIPFNVLGFSEALANDFPSLAPYYMGISLLTVCMLLVVTVTGADWAMKLQVFIMAALALGVVAFMSGAAMKFSSGTLIANLPKRDDGMDMFTLFALFFPAMTGIMAGVNMSGDLKNPSRSIPAGIIATIFTGAALYAVQILLCGGAFSREALCNTPYRVMVESAPLHSGFLVTIGVAAATLSTALGLLVCAPRVLQALARDRIIDGVDILAKGSGAHNEPRAALALTAAISLGIILWAGAKGLGGGGGKGMNMVAEIATMFFLFSYSMVNLAAFVESYGANPSFRPRFKLFHWSVALYGFLACVSVAILINALAATVSAVVATLIFWYVKRRKYEADFGDARRGFIYSRIRENLLKLSKTASHPKNWRPTIVILSGRPEEQMAMPYFASLLESERGIITLAKFVEMGNAAEALAERREPELEGMRRLLWDNNFYNIFPELVYCESYDKALRVFLQSHLVGPLKPNIVMLSFPKSEGRMAQTSIHMKSIASLGMSCIMMVNFNNSGVSPSRIVKGRIDLWWRGAKNLSLMLILAHLLITDPLWQGVYLRILRVSRTQEEAVEHSEELDGLVESARIEAEVKTIMSEEAFSTVMRRESPGASAIFLGFLPPETTEAGVAMFGGFQRMLSGMPPTFLVYSSGEADLSA